jgi:adenylate kinase
MDTQIQTIAEWLGTGSINIFGRPFAGKDTQGRIIADLFGGELISGGDILRSYHDQEMLKQIMASGELIPPDLFLSILVPFMAQPALSNKPLILSSIGRLEGEEQIILQATIDSNHPTLAVILLQLPEDRVWQHFEAAKTLNDRGARADDTSDVLKTRLHEFKTKTEPVIEFYRQNNLLIEIDGSLTREEVTNEILASLYSLASA